MKKIILQSIILLLSGCMPMKLGISGKLKASSYKEPQKQMQDKIK